VKKGYTVFSGKRKNLDELVLQALIDGRRTTMEIADHICQALGRQDRLAVHSTISRSGGALRRLEKDGFISRGRKMWDLTFKGAAASLVLFAEPKRIAATVREGYFSDEELEDLFADLKARRMLEPFIKPLVREIREVALEIFRSEEFWEEVKKQTEDLLDSGLDLVKITDQKFYEIVVGECLLWRAQKGKIFETLIDVRKKPPTERPNS